MLMWIPSQHIQEKFDTVVNELGSFCQWAVKPDSIVANTIISIYRNSLETFAHPPIFWGIMYINLAAFTIMDVVSASSSPNDFCSAIECGDRADVGHFLSRGANPNGKNHEGSTPLTIAAFNGDSAMTEFLLDRGANIDEQDAIGHSPLMIAAMKGHITLCELLLRRGADINVQCENFPILHLVARRGQLATCKLLREYGAKTNADIHGIRPTDMAILANHLDIAKFLHDTGSPHHYRDILGYTPLMRAAQSGNKEIVSYYLKHGVSPSLKNYAGKNVEDLARDKGHNAISDFLQRITTSR